MIPLKTTMTINALSSGATGIGLIALGNPISQLFGVTQVAAFVGVGIFLVLFAAYVLGVSQTVPISGKAVRFIIALDILWVISSVILIIFGSSAISGIGLFAIAAVAIWVAAMAFLQIKGVAEDVVR